MTQGLANAWPFGHTKLANDPLRCCQVAHIYPPQLPGGEGVDAAGVGLCSKNNTKLESFLWNARIKSNKNYNFLFVTLTVLWH